MRNNENHIYIDTNCLIGYIATKYGIYKDTKGFTKALQFLMALNGKKLYVSSLSVAQLTAKLQKRIGADRMVKEIEQIIHRFNVVEFNNDDIQSAITGALAKDIEDLYQYEMSQKVKCFYIMTDNLSDFTSLANITAFLPSKVRKAIF